MKLPEYRNQPHYLQWLVAWHLTRDYTDFEMAYRAARMGVEVLTEHVEAQAMKGIGEALGLSRDILTFALSLVDFTKLRADLLEVQPYE